MTFLGSLRLLLAIPFLFGGMPARAAIQLVQDWDAFRGYSARSLIAAAKAPPDLKPGLEITRANYPWLNN
jgi:hypothetical protein